MVKWKHIVILGLLVATYTPINAAQLDEKMFEKLSPKEQVAFVLSCLQARDQLLDSFSCKLTVKKRNVEIATGRDEYDFPMEKYELYRSGDTSLLHVWLFSKDGDLQTEWRQRWDGKERRAISVPLKKEERPSLAISDTESSVVGGIGYNLLLGYRVGGDPAVSVSRWIGLPVEVNRNSIEVSIDHSGKDPLLLVHIREFGYDHFRFWFDPTRDYLPVRFKMWNSTDKNEKSYVNWTTDEAVEVKKIGSVWIPMKVIRQSGQRDSSHDCTQWTYTVEQFTLDKPTPEKLDITVPADTTVNDTVHKEIYVLHGDGSKTFMNFYDPSTSKIVSATQQAAATQASATSTRPTVVPPATLPAAKPAGK